MKSEPKVITVDQRDDVEATLEGLLDLLGKHPRASFDLFQALAEEGRRYAQTREGAAVKARLADSELVHRARMVWECISANAFDAPYDGRLPSAFLEELLRAARAPDLESIIARLYRRT